MITSKNIRGIMGLVKRVILAQVILALILGHSNSSASFNQTDRSSDQPLWVIENLGQYNSEARFLLQWGPNRIWLAENALWVTQVEVSPGGESDKFRERGVQNQVTTQQKGVVLRFTFPGANPHPILEPFDLQTAQVSYFSGSDPAGWYPKVPVWGGVRYHNFYPGIDLVLDARAAILAGSGLPWRLETQAGADLSQVRMQIEGASQVGYDGAFLHMDTAIGKIILPALPVSLAGNDSLQVPAGSGSKEMVKEIRQGVFQLAAPLKTSLIQSDPAAPQGSADLVYSSFLGGSNWDTGYTAVADGAGSAYVAGRTPSTNFPITPGAFDVTSQDIEAFVVKFNPDGSGLVYATYLGGGSSDSAYAMAVVSGVVYLTGETLSFDFPTTSGAYDRSCGSDGTCNAGGQGPYADSFLAKISADGSSLLYSTFLGGSDDDLGNGIVVDNANAYLTGTTYSKDFPASGYVANGDVFAAMFSSSGGLTYARLIGGSDTDAGFSIDVSGGQAFITGETSSVDFPASGYVGGRDVFVSKLNSNGSIATGHLYGGSGDDMGYAIAVNTTGDILVAGRSSSSDFPVTESIYNGGISDAFLLKLGSSFITQYAAYLGGGSFDEATALTLDPHSGIYLAGSTGSTNFPVTSGAYQTLQAGGIDAFVAQIDLASTLPRHITYASYLGGEGTDRAYGLSIDPIYYSYLTGYTTSGNFPTTAGAFDQQLGGNQDAFVAKIAAGPFPGLALQKFTNDQDANLPPGPYIRTGQAVNWRYLVTNTGNAYFTNVNVSDNKGVTVTCPKTTLAVGENMTCTGWGLAVAGQYSNLGSASGTDLWGRQVTANDPSHYFGADPQSQLVKKTNGQDANQAPGPYLSQGSALEWTYEVANSGNVDLTNVRVVDDNGTPSNTADDVVVCTIPLLAAGTAQTCSLPGTAVAGQYSNLAVVTGTPPGGLANVTDSDPSYYFGSAPALSLVKKINDQDVTTPPGPYLLVGSPVTWKYEVKNTGNVILTNVTVVDDNGTPGATSDDRQACSIASLTPGAQQTCTLSGTAIAGQYTNIARVSGVPPVGPAVQIQDTSYYFGAQPSVGLEFLVNSSPADSSPGLFVPAGSALDWDYQVSNTGDVSLSNLVVRNDNGTPSNLSDDFTVCTIANLEAGANQVCSGSGTAITGQYGATASITADPPGGLSAVITSDPAYYFGAAPSLTLDKKTNGQDAETVPGAYVLTGSTVNWTYVLSNSGNVPLSNVNVVDDNGTPSNPGDDVIVCSNLTLAVSQQTTCTHSDTARVGQYANIARAAGTPPGSLSVVTASDSSHYFAVTPLVILTKQTNGQDAETAPGPLVLAGSTVTWTYKVTNAGDVALNNISIVDDYGTPGSTGDDVAVCSIESLAAGANQTCTHTGTAIAGQYANTARVTASPPGGLSVVSAQDVSHYFGVVTAISLVKSTNGSDANVPPGPNIRIGQAVNWTYVVKNEGNVALNSILVTDDQGVTVTCPGTTLQPGVSMTCTASGTAVAGQYSNIGSVTGQPVDFAQVSDSDPSHYFGSQSSVDIVKYTNGADANAIPGPYILVGQPVTWTYVIKNTGNDLLSGIVVTDDRGVMVSCPGTTLQPAASMTCTASGTASAGQYTNIGSVTANPPDIYAPVTDSDVSHYFGANPAIQIVTKTNDVDANDPPGPYIPVDGTVNWTYVVSNVGNLDLTVVQVSDNRVATVTCPKSELSIGEGMICTASGTATIDQYTNTGTAQAVASFGMGQVTASDVSYYFGYFLGISLVIYTNGMDVIGPPGPKLLSGVPVTWTYAVTNDGNVRLSNLSVTDNQSVLVSCPKAIIDPDETLICTANGIVSIGQYANTATAVAEYTTDSVTVEDTSYYFGIQPLKLYLPMLKR